MSRDVTIGAAHRTYMYQRFPHLTSTNLQNCKENGCHRNQMPTVKDSRARLTWDLLSLVTCLLSKVHVHVYTVLALWIRRCRIDSDNSTNPKLELIKIPLFQVYHTCICLGVSSDVHKSQLYTSNYSFSAGASHELPTHGWCMIQFLLSFNLKDGQCSGNLLLGCLHTPCAT